MKQPDEINLKTEAYVYTRFKSDVRVVVQFYPWFKVYFFLFKGMIMSLKQWEMTLKPRIKLSHNVHTLPEKQKLMTIIILIFFAGKWDLVCRTQLRMPKVGTM